MKWVDGFQIRVYLQDGVPVISANREGLRSLANHLDSLAEETPGSHIHLEIYRVNQAERLAKTALSMID